MGGLARCEHWLKELKNPIRVTQDTITTDLARFVHAFPLELIPHSSDLERDIDKLQLEAKKLRIAKTRCIRELQRGTYKLSNFGVESSE